MPNIPQFRDEFVESLAESLRKRHRALRNLAFEIEVYKVYETVGDEKKEGLEIGFTNGSGRRAARLFLHVWWDRSIWIYARAARKEGLVWEWTDRGRLSGCVSAKDVVAAVESTYVLIGGMEASRTQELSAVWKSLLAKGPVEVRPK